MVQTVAKRSRFAPMDCSAHEVHEVHVVSIVNNVKDSSVNML
jgi:hypothetical protein